MIDLHIHSTASDGSCTPDEIINIALEKGIKAISLTDHDTVDGVKEIVDKDVPDTLKFLAGIEISCTPPADFPGQESLHLLGYGIDIHDNALNKILEKLKSARAERNPLIIEKLNNLGFDISIEEVEARSSDGQTGRPHIAQVMVEKGFVSNFDQAFDAYLAKGKAAYVDKYRISVSEAINIISNAGGAAVLAHPGLIASPPGYPVEKLVRQLKKEGLAGVEVYYTDHSRRETRFFEKLAQEECLLATGGSDFHGKLKKGVNIGTGSGNLNIPHAVFKNLTDYLTHIEEKARSVENLQSHLGYRFNIPSLISQALCHKSYANEHKKYCLENNERLEFLGDAVLGLCISHLLMETAPDKNEGELSKIKSSLVSEVSLAELARNINLGNFVFLGRGEKLSQGADKDSILADTFEAVIAAVYLDCGFEGTYELIKEIFHEKMNAAVQNHNLEDYKTRLQEFVQEKGAPSPLYKITKETGPDHDKTFEVELESTGIRIKGFGKSKKAAEQDAAGKALQQLTKEPKHRTTQ